MRADAATLTAQPRGTSSAARRQPRRLSSLCVCLALCAAGSAAAAQPAAELFSRAQQAFSTANFERSAKLLRQAAGKTKDPRLLGQIHLYLGANQATMGQGAMARRSFHQALVNDPVLTMAPARFKSSTVRLFKEVHASMGGELLVTADRPGQVVLDGRPVGRTPHRARLVIGLHRVLVRGADGATWKMGQVVVGHGLVTTFSARAPTTGAAVTAKAKTTAAPAPRRGRLWTWISAGGAVVALGAAVGLTLAARADNKAYWEQDTDRRTGAELADSGLTKQRVGGVLYGVAGALAVTSVILYLVEGQPTDEAPGAASASSVRQRQRRRSLVTSLPRIGLLFDGGPGLTLAAPF